MFKLLEIYREIAYKLYDIKIVEWKIKNNAIGNFPTIISCEIDSDGAKIAFFECDYHKDWGISEISIPMEEIKESMHTFCVNDDTILDKLNTLKQSIKSLNPTLPNVVICHLHQQITEIIEEF